MSSRNCAHGGSLTMHQCEGDIVIVMGDKRAMDGAHDRGHIQQISDVQ
jgi:hypothetical protein